MFEYKMYEEYEINGVSCREIESLATICKNDEEFVERCREFGAKGKWYVEKYDLENKFGIPLFQSTLIDTFRVDLGE